MDEHRFNFRMRGGPHTGQNIGSVFSTAGDLVNQSSSSGQNAVGNTLQNIGNFMGGTSYAGTVAAATTAVSGAVSAATGAVSGAVSAATTAATTAAAGAASAAIGLATVLAPVAVTGAIVYGICQLLSDD